MTVVFENARFDEIQRTLDARAQLRSGPGGSSGLIEITLRCTQVQFEEWALHRPSRSAHHVITRAPSSQVRYESHSKAF